MGTYNIPRNYGGETRILYVFSVKSLITTALGIAIGGIFYIIFKMVLLEKIGIGFLIFFGVLGYIIGALKIPTIAGLPITKKIGGEPIFEIIIRYFKYKRNKKIYTYTNTKEEE